MSIVDQPVQRSSSSTNTTIQPGGILIVTVTKVEAQAVLEIFAGDRKWDRQAIGNKTYYHLGVHANVPIFMVQSEMGTATPGGALLNCSVNRYKIYALKPLLCAELRMVCARVSRN